MNGNSIGDEATPAAAQAGTPARRERRFLCDLRPGDRADEIFVINNIQLGTKRNGEPFLKMLVSDRTGRVATKWWDKGQAMLERLPDPGVVRIKGRMEDFNGSPQFVIDQVFPVSDKRTIDYGELLPSTAKDIEAMFGEVQRLLRGLASPTLRAVAEAYLRDECLMESFRRAPAAMTFHHAFLGGLLEHTLNAMHAAERLCGLYPQLNGDLVVLGIFLHDLAKTWELVYDTCFDYTDGGRLVGHIVKSAMWVEQKVKEAESILGRPIPVEVVDVLQHIILAHHGELELGFGSARSPSTPEAWAVHLIENLDAKMTMALAVCRWDEAGGRWTDYHKALGGRLFRPDVILQADASLAADAPPAPSRAPAPPPGNGARRARPGEPEEQPPGTTISNPLFEV